MPARTHLSSGRCRAARPGRGLIFEAHVPSRRLGVDLSRKAIGIYTSHLVMLPCQLVWQEAEVAMLGKSRNLHDLPIFTCARRLKRRAQVKIGEQGGLRCLAYEPYSPTRRARGGQKSCVDTNAAKPGEGCCFCIEVR